MSDLIESWQKHEVTPIQTSEISRVAVAQGPPRGIRIAATDIHKIVSELDQIVVNARLVRTAEMAHRNAPAAYAGFASNFAVSGSR